LSEEPKLDDLVTDRQLLFRIARELKDIRALTSKALFAMGEAEKEIPEKMRRFMNYFHDVVHVKGEYVTLGLPCPKWIDASRSSTTSTPMGATSKRSGVKWLNTPSAIATTTPGNSPHQRRRPHDPRQSHYLRHGQH